MTDNEIIQEATEAVEKNLNAGCYVGELLRIVKEQKAEIDILIRKKEALRDEVERFCFVLCIMTERAKMK